MQEIIDIKSRLEQIDQQRAELAAELAQKQSELLRGFIDGIKQQAADAGYALADIIAGLQPQAVKRARKSKSESAGETRNYPTYRHPQDSEKVYVRGVLPGWMKEEMASRGLDPANKEHREKFKSEFLVRDGATTAPVEMQEAA